MPKNNKPISTRGLTSVCITFALLIALSSSSLFSTKPDDLISLKLRRLQVDPWIVNSTIPNDNCYNPEKMDADYTHQYQISKIPIAFSTTIFKETFDISILLNPLILFFC